MLRWLHWSASKGQTYWAVLAREQVELNMLCCLLFESLNKFAAVAKPSWKCEPFMLALLISFCLGLAKTMQMRCMDNMSLGSLIIFLFIHMFCPTITCFYTYTHAHTHTDTHTHTHMHTHTHSFWWALATTAGVLQQTTCCLSCATWLASGTSASRWALGGVICVPNWLTMLRNSRQSSIPQSF